jgi:hypothetical protein
MSVSSRGSSRLRGLFRSLLPSRGAHRRETSRRRLESDLAVHRQAVAHWQQYADSYARELDRARHERALLLAWLAALHPASAVITPTAGTAQDGTHRSLRLVAGGWPMSWRIPPGDLALFRHVPYAEAAADHPETWPDDSPDRPDSPDQYAHIRRHTRLLALEATVHDITTGTEPSDHPAGH